LLHRVFGAAAKGEIVNDRSYDHAALHELADYVAHVFVIAPKAIDADNKHVDGPQLVAQASPCAYARHAIVGHHVCEPAPREHEQAGVQSYPYRSVHASHACLGNDSQDVRMALSAICLLSSATLLARKKSWRVLRLAGEPCAQLLLDLGQFGALVVDEVQHGGEVVRP